MHKIYILFTFLILAIPSLAQLSGSYSVGSGQTYTSLSNANGLFAAINSSGLNGNVTISITSDITETGNNPLNQWTESGGSGYTLTIQPDGTTLRTLTSTTSASVYLNGADRVTVNGGAGKYLTFKCTDAASPVFYIINGAISNTITNCNIESDVQSFTSSVPSSAAILIAANGSDTDNEVTISNCNISSSDISVPMGCGIFIYSTDATNTNTVTVSNNNIYNFAATTASNYACGIYLYDAGALASTSTASTISDNSFYCNLSANPTSHQVSVSINGGDVHTISGNYIGGQAAECGGSAWNHAGTSTNFLGVNIYNLSNVAVHAQIENNNISNISVNNWFYGINSYLSNITVDGNTIGHVSTVNSINLTGNDGYFYGIEDYNNTTSSFANTITDNIIANVTHTAEFPGHTYGISLNTVANVDVKRNKIYRIGPQNNTTYYTKIYGVSIANPSGTATLTLVNNVISLGGTTETKSDWFSIYDKSSSGISLYLLYNSLYLSGTSNDDANSIARCVSRDGTSTFYSKNNIFYNSRSDDVNDEIYYFASTIVDVTSDNNIFYVPDGDVAYYNSTSYTTLANWQTVSSKDGSSLSQDPNYTSPAGNPADLSIPSSNNAGVHLASFTTDINGTTRDASNPDAGAYEFGAANWTGNTNTAWDNTGNWSTSTVPTSSDNVYISGSLSNYPAINVTAVCNNIDINDDAEVTVASGGNLTCSGHFYMNNAAAQFTVSGGTFTCAGNFVGVSSTWAKGTITFSGGTVDLNGGWLVIDGSDGTLTISGADVKFGGTDIYVNSDDFTMTSGSLTFDGTASQNLQSMGGSSTYTLTDANIENTANDVNIIGSLTANGTVDIDPSALLFINADLTVNSGKTVNINADGALSVNSNLTNNGTLTINSTSETASGSLIVSGTATGNVTYNRWMTYDKWHIVSAPVETQDISDLLTSGTNSIALNGSNYGVTHYLEGTNAWGTYYTSSTPDNFTSGVGYLMRRQTTDGTVSFTGTVADADFTVSIDSTDHAWNALGNPFTSALNANSTADDTDNLLTINTSVLHGSFAALYIWDEQINYTGNRHDYRVINHVAGPPDGETSLAQDYIQAGQGFIVKAKTNGVNFSFTRAMQSHQTTTPFKSGEINNWADINIIANIEIEDSEISTKTKLKFNSQMTNGLDVGYDAGVLKMHPDFSLFTKLAEDNGVEFMLQCLPTQNLETLEIPIGLDATAGGEISFRIEKNNFTESMIPVLNDKLLDIEFPFTSDGDVYNTTINDNIKGFGRFSLTFASTTDAEDIAIEKQHFKAWFSNGKINLYGKTTGTEIVRVYNISGQEISNTRLENTNLNTIDLPQKISGIYLIRIEKISGTEVLKVPVLFN